jgi:hypothetical protein
MTENHIITPPPELVQQWTREYDRMDPHPNIEPFIATRAAQWGADQELEACCEWLHAWTQDKHPGGIENLRAARRPKPKSLNSIAMQMLGTIERDGHYIPEITDIIRRALEQLPDNKES